MKIISVVSFFIICFIAIGISGCKKKDYRLDYTGSYKFTIIKSDPYDSTFSDSTIYYSGQISIGSNSNDIIISYLPNYYTFDALLSQDGTLQKNPSEGLSVGFNGKFESINKISFTTFNIDKNYRVQNVTGIKY
jgi:hypothetical protein